MTQLLVVSALVALSLGGCRPSKPDLPIIQMEEVGQQYRYIWKPGLSDDERLLVVWSKTVPGLINERTGGFDIFSKGQFSEDSFPMSITIMRNSDESFHSRALQFGELTDVVYVENISIKMGHETILSNSELKALLSALDEPTRSKVSSSLGSFQIRKRGFIKVQTGPELPSYVVCGLVVGESILGHRGDHGNESAPKPVQNNIGAEETE